MTELHTGLVPAGCLRPGRAVFRHMAREAHDLVHFAAFALALTALPEEAPPGAIRELPQVYVGGFPPCRCFLQPTRVRKRCLRETRRTCMLRLHLGRDRATQAMAGQE